MWWSKKKDNKCCGGIEFNVPLSGIEKINEEMINNRLKVEAKQKELDALMEKDKDYIKFCIISYIEFMWPRLDQYTLWSFSLFDKYRNTEILPGFARYSPPDMFCRIHSDAEREFMEALSENIVKAWKKKLKENKKNKEL